MEGVFSIKGVTKSGPTYNLKHSQKRESKVAKQPLCVFAYT